MRRREFLTGAAALAAYGQMRSAEALTPQQRLLLKGASVPSWVLPGAIIDMDFADSLYFGGTLASLISTSRNSTKYAAMASGLLVPFSTNISSITDLGFLIEEGRSNICLWGRDLTNAVWTKSNITAALDQVGADGVLNAATSLTATADNGTVLQSITSGSAQRVLSAYIKRVSGSGNVDLTTDNGASWTTIIGLSAVRYNQFPITAQTLANPVVGFRLGTNGDKIAVDFSQSEIGPFATSPIATTAASANRQPDIITPIGALATGFSAAVGSILAQLGPLPVGINLPVYLATRNGSAEAFFRAANTTTVGARQASATAATATFGAGSFTTPPLNKVAVSWDGSGTSMVANAGTPATAATTFGAAGTMNIGSLGGSTSFMNAYLKRLTIW